MSVVRQRFVAGELIISEGDRADRAFELLTGSVGIYKQDQRVAVIETSGELFGELYLFNAHGVRTATVLALEDTEVEIIFEEDLFIRLHPIPQLIQTLMSTLCQHLIETTHHYAQEIACDTSSV